MVVSKGSAHALFLSMLRTQGLLLVSRDHLPRAHADVDSAAYPVLFELSRGDLRVGDLATVVRGDLSTVSRQVSALSRLGLVSKDTDPSDGRAQIVSLTDSGRGLLQRITDIRASWLQELLCAWEDTDVLDASHRLEALGDLLEAWLRGRGATPPPPPAGIAPS